MVLLAQYAVCALTHARRPPSKTNLAVPPAMAWRSAVAEAWRAQAIGKFASHPAPTWMGRPWFNHQPRATTCPSGLWHATPRNHRHHGTDDGGLGNLAACRDGAHLLRHFPEFLFEIGIERSCIAKRLVSDSNHVHSFQYYTNRAILGAIHEPYNRTPGCNCLCVSELF